MREIIFRGKRCDNGEWVYGSLVCLPGNNEIGYIAVFIEDEAGLVLADNIEVNLNTVGQYTGLKDKNGKRIFEGDAVRYGKTHVGVINYKDCCFCVKLKEKGWMNRNNPAMDIVVNEYPNEIEVIGNIHDSPETIKKSEGRKESDV